MPCIFYREKNSALSSLVDSRRIVPTHARHSQQLILFFIFANNNVKKSHHGGTRTPGPTLVDSRVTTRPSGRPASSINIYPRYHSVREYNNRLILTSEYKRLRYCIPGQIICMNIIGRTPPAGAKRVRLSQEKAAFPVQTFTPTPKQCKHPRQQSNPPHQQSNCHAIQTSTANQERRQLSPLNLFVIMHYFVNHASCHPICRVLE